MTAVRYILASSLLLLSACTVGPDYTQPEIDVPDAWHVSIAQQLQQGSEAKLQSWWVQLNDPELNQLIDRARRSNLDLKTAASRVREARAKLAMSTGERLPTIGASAQASTSRQSTDGVLQQVAPANGFKSQNLYEIGVDASWEVDLFGRVRRTIESSQAQYEATVEAERDVLVTLCAEVALAYVEIREFQNRLVYARSNVAAQEESLTLAEDRFQNGLTSRLDVVQAQSNLDTTRAAIPGLVIAQNQTMNRLAVLLGEEAGSLQKDFVTVGQIPEPNRDLTLAVPADVLRQRPDIRRAERQLAAQTANIGVATAALYPDFSLTGFLGLQSRSISDLFTGDAEMWGISAPMQWNLFNGGQVRSNIRVQEELAEQALLNYQQTILQAIEEVENSLQSYSQDSVRVDILKNAVIASREAARLAVVQYNNGLTEFNNVMTMQRYLFQLEEQLASSKAQRIIDLIALYKAMGGGW